MKTQVIIDVYCFLVIAECFRVTLRSLLLSKGQPPAFHEEGRHSNEEQKGLLKEQKQIQGCQTRAQTRWRRQAYE